MDDQIKQKMDDVQNAYKTSDVAKSPLRSVKPKSSFSKRSSQSA